ncbi:HEAT repeat domain-containing protein [Chryseobacterium indoltheticum]|uniref:HEAT repeat domain-containing protein n=1 Tax=Chryseobacterium indoltheticum TaxID=254 RepID=UPI0019127DD2|nr:HEAT repeat domain-containing protein [Chryseobacterium indoltheticum]QQQ29534.1 HEAT repeat domain-containing protein [Chryseobacterium indoltheticum]
MKDSLKKYIEDHREEFDTLEVPEETFDKIMSKLNEPAFAEKTIPLFTWKKWIAAASIVIIFSIGSFALWNQKENKKSSIAIQEKTKAEDENLVEIIKPKNELETAKIMTTKQENSPKVFEKNNLKHSKRIAETKNLVQDNSSATEYDFENVKALELMADEYSASSRLEGISRINNFLPSDEKMIAILSEKALSDENTNVRLAAVEALSAHIENTTVRDHIREIFLNQDDPFVQKELIAILAQKNPSKLNSEVSAKLRELTLNPTTAVFVKDEAYAVLMKY